MERTTHDSTRATPTQLRAYLRIFVHKDAKLRNLLVLLRRKHISNLFWKVPAMILPGCQQSLDLSLQVYVLHALNPLNGLGPGLHCIAPGYMPQEYMPQDICPRKLQQHNVALHQPALRKEKRGVKPEIALAWELTHEALYAYRLLH